MRIRRVEKYKFRIYLQKAEEFYYEMQDALEKERWNAVGLNGIHCLISSCDALTTYFLGKRSASEKHEDVVKLLAELGLEERIIKEKINQALSILRSKTRVEYEGELFTEKEARRMAKQVERFYEWAVGVLS
jgi:uncharacterized protein (UPF0332 family)